MSDTFNFLKNKYTKWYFNIVSAAQNRDISGYIEKHHIIPKSLGGNNKKENLVNLSGREHFICHWLLTKMVSDTKQKYQMWNAFSCMLYRERPGQDRYRVNSKTFECIKKSGSTIKSKMWSGKGNPMYKKIHSTESREKMSVAATGRIKSEEHKKNLSDSTKGKLKSESHKEKLKAAAATRWSAEARDEWSIKMKARAQLNKLKEFQ